MELECATREQAMAGLKIHSRRADSAKDHSVSQARSRLFEGRSRCAATLPAFASFVLQSEAACLTLLRFHRRRLSECVKLILTAASVFHIEEPVGSYDCVRHFILITGRAKVPKF